MMILSILEIYTVKELTNLHETTFNHYTLHLQSDKHEQLLQQKVELILGSVSSEATATPIKP